VTNDGGQPEWTGLIELVTNGIKGLAALPEDERLRKIDQSALESAELADFIGKTFGIPKLQPDGSGPIESKLIDLLAHYMSWCADWITYHRAGSFHVGTHRVPTASIPPRLPLQVCGAGAAPQPILFRRATDRDVV
jgi:hypothetical protein